MVRLGAELLNVLEGFRLCENAEVDIIPLTVRKAMTGVTYLNPGLRGLEGGDNVTITDLQTITVDWTAGNPGDYIRVLTDFSPGAVIPIPATIWLFGSGLLGLIGISKRKKAA